MTARQAAVVLPVLAASVVAGACAEAGPEGTWEVRDSAGVEVVESAAPGWPAGGGWTVAHEPRLELGMAEGPRALMFDGIAGVVRVGDTIVVADGGSGELRFFGTDGAHARSVGGSGDGPGEYRWIQRIGRWRGDSLFVFDGRLGRVSVLDRYGGFARSWSVAGPAGGLEDLQPLAGGRWVGLVGATIRPGAPGTVARDTAHFLAVTPGSEGATVDTLAAVPGIRTFTFSFDGDEGYAPAPLTPTPAWDAAGGRLYVTAGDAFEARVFDGAGTLTRIIRRPRPAPEATAEHMAAWRDDHLADVPEPARPRLGSLLSRFPRPSHLPVYHRLLVDPLGSVWLERFRVPSGGSGEWDVYDGARRFLGSVQTPPGFTVLDVTRDELLGVWRDEAGVESVRIYALDRSGG